MTCQFAFLKERNIICPWINFISQLPWKFWKCLLIIANLQGVICAVKRSVAKVTSCTGAKTLTRACPPIGTAVDNIWLTFSFVLTDNTSVSDSSVVSPYSLPPPRSPPPQPQAVRTGWLVVLCSTNWSISPNTKKLWADSGKKKKRSCQKTSALPDGVRACVYVLRGYVCLYPCSCETLSTPSVVLLLCHGIYFDVVTWFRSFAWPPTPLRLKRTLESLENPAMKQIYNEKMVGGGGEREKERERGKKAACDRGED